MGVELVEGRDLVVDDHVVSMRTTHGLKRVDVIYRRIDDAFLDPVVFRRDSILGVPGLMSRGAGRQRHHRQRGGQRRGRRQGRVRLRARAHPLLPRRRADPRRACPPTSCGTRTSGPHVLDRLDELVVKPVAESGGYGMLIGPSATDAECAAMRKRDRGRPAGLHRPGGGAAVAAPHARRRPPRGPPRRPPAVRALRRPGRGDPRRAHPRRAPQGEPRRELQPGRRQQGHLGARRPRTRRPADDARPPRRDPVLGRAVHRAGRGHRPHARRHLPRPARGDAVGGRAVVERPAQGPVARPALRRARAGRAAPPPCRSSSCSTPTTRARSCRR